MRTILIASPKGGCGKTTVATNLAVFYATAVKETALIDCDRQGSSLHWAEKRAALAHPVLGMAGKVGSKVTARVPTGTKRCIVDTAAGITAEEVETYLDDVDALVVPVLASSFDLEASQAFLHDVGRLPKIKRGKLPGALVAKRLKAWTNASQQGVEAMKELHFPLVAQLRDSIGGPGSPLLSGALFIKITGGLWFNLSIIS